MWMRGDMSTERTEEDENDEIRSLAFCLLIQLGHMPRNVAISMITIPIPSSLSIFLAEKKLGAHPERRMGLVAREGWILCTRRRISVLPARLSRSKRDIH